MRIRSFVKSVGWITGLGILVILMIDANPKTLPAPSVALKTDPGSAALEINDRGKKLIEWMNQALRGKNIVPENLHASEEATKVIDVASEYLQNGDVIPDEVEQEMPINEEGLKLKANQLVNTLVKTRNSENIVASLKKPEWYFFVLIPTILDSVGMEGNFYSDNRLVKYGQVFYRKFPPELIKSFVQEIQSVNDSTENHAAAPNKK